MIQLDRKMFLLQNLPADFSRQAVLQLKARARIKKKLLRPIPMDEFDSVTGCLLKMRFHASCYSCRHVLHHLGIEDEDLQSVADGQAFGTIYSVRI